MDRPDQHGCRQSLPAFQVCWPPVRPRAAPCSAVVTSPACMSARKPGRAVARPRAAWRPRARPAARRPRRRGGVHSARPCGCRVQRELADHSRGRPRSAARDRVGTVEDAQAVHFGGQPGAGPGCVVGESTSTKQSRPAIARTGAATVHRRLRTRCTTARKLSSSLPSKRWAAAEDRTARPPPLSAIKQLLLGEVAISGADPGNRATGPCVSRSARTHVIMRPRGRAQNFAVS